MHLHRAAQMQRSCQVIMIIPQRLLTGLAYRLQAREMNDCRNRLLIEYTIHALLIQQIHLIKREVPSRNRPNPLQSFRLGIAEIIQYHNIISRVQKLHAGMTSDISGSASYQDHALFPPHTVIICFRISTACAAALAENSA